MNYLISGTSNYLINKELNKILNGEEYTKIDYLEVSMEEIIIEASYNDLFASKKNIIVKNATCFNEKNEAATKCLTKYLDNPNDNTTLIFITDKVQEKLKIVSLMKEKAHTILMKSLYLSDATSKLMEEVKTLGYTISYEDAKYIVDISLNNFDIAMNNVTKICLYYNSPCKFLSSDIKALTSNSLDDNLFRFVDYVINFNYNQVFKMLNDFKIQKIEPFVIFNMLSREYRHMLLVKEMYHRSNRNDYLKALNLKEWQLDKLLKNSSNYTLKSLEDNLVKLALLDLDIKSGKIDKYLALETYLLGLDN